MTRRYRTVVAFLVAPLTAPVIFGVIAATSRPQGEGPTWIGSFGQVFVLVGIVSYGISYAVGIPSYFFLRWLHRESVLAYMAISATVGFLYLPVLNGFRGISPELIADSVIFALLGTSVGVAFSIIAGLANASNPSLDPTSSSVTPPAGQEPRRP